MSSFRHDVNRQRGVRCFNGCPTCEHEANEQRGMYCAGNCPLCDELRGAWNAAQSPEKWRAYLAAQKEQSRLEQYRMEFEQQWPKEQ